MRGPMPKQHSEFGHRDFDAHLIDAGLVASAQVLLEAEPGILLAKQGRPYLDYAFRDMHSPQPAWNEAEALARRLGMMEMLLSRGSTVNELVWIHANRTVWELYLDSLVTDMAMVRDREVVWALIHNGAKRAADFTTPKAEKLSMDQLLASV